MALYRANPADGVAWITGASTGIGRSLAIDLARQGYTVVVTARDEERLSTVSGDAKGLPGKVIAYPCDVTDEPGMARLVDAIERDVGPIVLAVFNAGNYFPTRGERLDVLNFLKTYEVNVFGVVFGLVPVVERMRERGNGQIAFVASVSGYFGWPSTAAYGASKSALYNMAESLKYDFDKLNIRIQVMNPGFIDTPLTEKNGFAMPALMSVSKASERIAGALKSGGFETTFPRRFTWFLKVLRILPQPLRFWFINNVTGWKKRPIASGRKRREL